MITEEHIDAMHAFDQKAKAEFIRFLDTLSDEPYEAAAALILKSAAAGGRLHITGIGKPGHVAGYAASLISATGTPAYELHGTEAVHGSCGQLVRGDVVICISNSGEPAELLATIRAVQNNGCEVIAVTGKPESSVARLARVHLFAGVDCEGGPLNRAPRASILAEIYVLQRLSVLLQAHRGLTPDEYLLRHPGGSLGVRRENE